MSSWANVRPRGSKGSPFLSGFGTVGTISGANSRTISVSLIARNRGIQFVSSRNKTERLLRCFSKIPGAGSLTVDGRRAVSSSFSVSSSLVIVRKSGLICPTK